MNESTILSKWDDLIKSGQVEYDEGQEIIQHTDGELKFQFVLSSALSKKPGVGSSGQVDEENDDLHRDGSDINTGGFEVGNVGNSHFLAVNKFCFAKPHLLLLTLDGYQRQYTPLDENDIKAAWTALTAIDRDYVVLYNCGQDGGCSRLHEHMQLMPTPEYHWANFLDTQDSKEPDVPFKWFYRRFNGQDVTTADLYKIYSELLQQSTEVGEGLSDHAADASLDAAVPHNMILTKRWMVVLPRRRAKINKKVGVNAIGMLGYIALATKEEIDVCLKKGSKEGMREVGVPK